MMNQQPDNFFREKLGDYHKAAPEAAWDRIASALEKPKPKIGWLKIAASLLLATSLGYVLLQLRKNSDKPPLAQTAIEQPSPSIEPDQIKSDLHTESQQPAIAHDKKASSVTEAKVKKVPSKKDTPSEKITPIIDSEPSLALTENNFPREVSSESIENKIEPLVTTEKKSTRLTLTYNVEDTDKYLDKNALAEATPDEKKSSTFKKLLKKANDLKNNQDPFGDLREKKNEILALNFKNEKRGQNK